MKASTDVNTLKGGLSVGLGTKTSWLSSNTLRTVLYQTFVKPKRSK